MAVTMSATITDKGVTATVQNLKKGCNATKVAEVAAKAMVHTWLPRVFDTNAYGWKPVLRGGTPLRKSARTSSSIRSAFVYSVSGAIASIRNVFAYAHIHDKGATIRAKNAKMLRFKIGDRWASKKSVTIPQRRFMYWPAAAKKFVLDRVNFYMRETRKGRPA